MTNNNLRPTARVARGATYVFIQGFVTTLVSLVYFIALAHALPQDDMGAFALLSFLVLLPSILGTFSLNSAAIKYIPQYLAENNPEKAKAVVSRILQISLLSSAVTFVLLFVPAEWISTLVFGQSDFAFLLRLLALSSIFTILQVMTISFLQGLQRMREVSLLNAAYTFIQVPLSISLLLAGAGLLAAVIGWLVGLAVIAVAGLLLVIKYLGLTRKLSPIGPLLRFALPLYFAGVVGYFATWVDQLVLASLASRETLGIYFVAVRASVVPTLFASAVVIALFPQISELYTTQGIGSLKGAFQVSVRYAVLIGFPLILGVAVLAYPTIILLAGFEYAGAAVPLIIISFAAIASTLGIAIGPILLTLERTKIASLLSLVSVGAELLFSYIALAVLNSGMFGVAWARTLSVILVIALDLYVVARYVPISFDKEAIWKVSAASVFMILAVIGTDLVRMVLSPSTYHFLEIRLVLLPVYIIIGALAYVVAIILLRVLKKQDLQLIEEYLPRRLKFLANLLRRFVKVE